MNDQKKIYVIVKQPLFWPIVWVFIFFPVGLLWLFFRIGSNSRVENNGQVSLSANIVRFTLLILGAIALYFLYRHHLNFHIYLS